MSEFSKNVKIIESRLRIMTWNIWWRFGPWVQREPAILQCIADLNPDVIALQEVWGDGETNFAEKVADRLGYQHVFASSMEIRESKFGNALLSRWPIVRDDFTMLFGEKETGEGRLALFAEVNGPRGSIPVFSTHLNWKYEQSHIRQRQVTDLARFVDQKRPFVYPPIVCGDFNSEPGSDEIRMLTGLTNCPVEGLVFHDAWAVAGGDGRGITWDNCNPYVVVEFEPDRRLDYIFVGGPGSGGAGHIVDCNLAGNKPIDGVWPSDHYAVVAELRY
jgi:endonuclease/exonuclease/phosphatase family metal-dependent hydrolase